MSVAEIASLNPKIRNSIHSLFSQVVMGLLLVMVTALATVMGRFLLALSWTDILQPSCLTASLSLLLPSALYRFCLSSRLELPLFRNLQVVMPMGRPVLHSER